MRNREVGGLPESYHLYGLAVDCVLDDPLVKEAFLKSARRFDLDAIDEGGHIHLEPKL